MTNSKSSWIKKTLLVTVLAAASANVVHADDGVGRFSDSYRYFASQPTIESPSAWRQANPSGLSNSQLEQLSSEALTNEFNVSKLTFDKASSSFKQTHPKGLSDRELQALSSEGWAWHSQDAATAVASGTATVVARTPGK
jgi:uncharacterized protein YjiK